MLIRYLTDLHTTGIDVVDNAIFTSIEKLVKSKEEVIVIGGDIFNSYEIGATTTLFYDFCLKLSNKVKGIYILTGNHDKDKSKVCFRLFDYAKSNIKIIDSYFFMDDGAVRYHFIPHYRNYIDFDISFGDNKNVGFTHADLNSRKKTQGIYDDFDIVYNGHLHDKEKFNNIYNVGSFRQTRVNEEPNSYSLLIKDGEVIEDTVNPTPVRHITHMGTNLKNVDMSVPSFVTWKVPLDFDKSSFTFDNPNIRLKFETINSKEYVVKKQDAAKDISLEEDFYTYLRVFDDQFKTNYINDKSKLYSIVNSCAGFTGGSSINNIKLECMEMVNFQLFHDAKIDFYNLSGTIGVNGLNCDDLLESSTTSNEAGKSTIRKALEYAFLGAKAKLTPLKRGQEKGKVRLVLSINDTQFALERTFNTIDNDLRIYNLTTNTEIGKDDTKTAKWDTFNTKYNLSSFIESVVLKKSMWIDNFFNGSNKIRNEILSSRFDFLNRYSLIAEKVNADLKSLSKSLMDKESELKSLLEIRKQVGRSAFRSIYDTRKSLSYLDGVKPITEVVPSVYLDTSYDVDRARADINYFDNLSVLGANAITESMYGNIMDYENKIRIIPILERDIAQEQKDLEKLKSDYISVGSEIKKAQQGICPILESTPCDKVCNLNYISNCQSKLAAIELNGVTTSKQLEDKKQTLVLYKEYESRYSKEIFRAIEYVKGANKPLGNYTDALFVSENGSKLNAMLAKKDAQEKLEASIESMLKTQDTLIADIRSKNKEYNTAGLKKEIASLKVDVKLYEDLATILFKKKSRTFETFMLNKFLSTVESNITVIVSNLFSRDIKVLINDDKISFLDNGRECSFDDFSGGASTKIKIALALTITELYKEYCNRFDTIFIDEFLDDGVDSVNIKKIMEIIKALDIKSKFVISHLPIESFCDEVILVERKNESSSILI